MADPDPPSLLDTIFFSYAQRRRELATYEARRFVHYTTAEAAISIIDTEAIWLRNSAVMNDWSEIAHGESCFRYIFYGDNETRHRSERVLNEVSAGLHERAAEYFEDTAGMRRAHTYLLSISEHGPERVAPGVVDLESSYGRLSMWRAYGARGGVALILNPEPFFSPSNALNAFTSPVFYGMPNDFAMEYERILTAIERNAAAIREFADGEFEQALQLFIHFSSLSCKHPGFGEEREWRVTYSASPGVEHVSDDEFNATSPIKREFRTVAGLPQRIYKIPFQDHPDQGLSGVTLPALLHRIVIGPTQYPVVIYDAIHAALRRAGVAEPDARIAISQIPLRT